MRLEMLPFLARRRWGTLPLVLALAFGAGGFTLACRPARAAGDLNKALAEMAKKIKQFLDQKGLDAISVGEFTAPVKLTASAGPAIAKTLSDELTALGVAVKRSADLEVNGRYQDVDDKNSLRLAVRIRAHLVDARGDEVLALEPRAVFDLATIALLTGLTASMPADGDDQDRNDALAEALDKPVVHLAGARVSADGASPYALEIQVKDEGGEGYHPRAASQADDGFAYVTLARREAYAVKLINDSPYDAAVTLTIDGLSVFAFSENQAYTHYIVPSKQTLTVPGWHRNNQRSDAFLVTEYAQSAAAEALPNSGAVGTITASFAAAWPQGAAPPDDEAPGKKGARNGDATGRGPAVDFKLVEVVRDVGRLRAAVSVRYNRTQAPNDLPGGFP